ncbi:CooT family nickel-binding protein [Malonomonas rubra]|uniref:CooT family nickel-binding protein n=1 Tax=Malonomonas rubra TaxID=57040 RepID=UPI0026E97734|nr:CooT family nickel-binding protein [Malonomonas rubra]
MCLDYGPFKLVSNDQETDLQDISSIMIQEDSLKLIDSFGKTSTMSGKICEIDLMNQRIVLA